MSEAQASVAGSMSDPRLAMGGSELRRRAAGRWVEVADGVLETVMTASRRSLPIRVRVSGVGDTFLGEQVVVATLRTALDGALPDAATSHVSVVADSSHHLERIVVGLVARYGADLVELGDRARAIVVGQLAAWGEEPATAGSGPVDRPSVVIRPSHVHVEDVVTGNPHLVSPRD